MSAVSAGPRVEDCESHTTLTGRECKSIATLDEEDCKLREEL